MGDKPQLIHRVARECIGGRSVLVEREIGPRPAAIKRIGRSYYNSPRDMRSFVVVSA